MDILIIRNNKRARWLYDKSGITIIFLGAIKILLEDGKSDKVLELINKVLKEE